MSIKDIEERYKKYLEEFKDAKKKGTVEGKPMTFKEFAPNVATRRG